MSLSAIQYPWCMQVGGGGLRVRTRQAVRAQLAELAMGMFLERGYDETTVDEIAAAAGMSRRSFFRYFPSKEDVVFGEAEEAAERVAAEIRDHPGGASAWDCLHAVLRREHEQIHDVHRTLSELRLIESSPALRARLAVKREQMRASVQQALREREGAELDEFTADLLVSAAGAALEAVDREWLRSGGKADRGQLVDHAFAQLKPRSAEDRPG
jgi:AcrR family transcriptional regulator